MFLKYFINISWEETRLKALLNINPDKRSKKVIQVSNRTQIERNNET